MAIETLMVRERILEQLEVDFTKMQDNNEEPLFMHVQRGPLEYAQNVEHNTVGIVDQGDFGVIYELGYIMPNLRVAIEFHVEIMQGDKPSTRLNEVLKYIQNYMLKNLKMPESGTGDELSINVKYNSFEPDIGVFNTNFASGVVIYDITYRHAKEDATELR